MNDLVHLYENRFSEAENRRKDAVWAVLCRRFFQNFVRETDTVLDIACGRGEFIRHIGAGRKIAVDANPTIARLLGPDIEFHAVEASKLGFLGDAQVDICFTSNFFEHLPSKSAMLDVLRECHRVLRPGGRLMALQPNIRYLAREYWDFFDHVTPLSHLSCAEGFALAGFDVDILIDRFLPYTTKSRLPQHPLLVRGYLAFPPAWRLLGKQFFIVGAKRR